MISKVVDAAGCMNHLGAECVDSMRLSPQQEAGRKPDYLLFDRQVVVEVKHLRDDRENVVQRVVDTWKQRPGWPLVFGTHPLQQVLEKHPCKEQINREIFDAVMHSVEAAFEQANRQLRDSRRSFDLPDDCCGLLLLVNEEVWFLHPEALRVELCRLWAKRNAQGGDRFSSVDWVVVLTAAHATVDENGEEHIPLLSLSSPGRQRTDEFCAIEDRFLRGIAEFVGLPYRPTTADELGRLRTTHKAPVPRIMLQSRGNER
jgi:hypothetical protein